MSYVRALERAGAIIIAFKNFGSYQGEWYAVVRYKGKRGIVQGSFGSCSHCDAFDAEFGDAKDYCEEHWGGQEGCPDCMQAAHDHEVKLAQFGIPYLEGMIEPGTKLIEILQARLAEESEWDDGAKEAHDWLIEQIVGFGNN